jgi:pyruvate/2-oxoglutarate dehydrogenase complex dihydrolipoamide dehydrogenase (E3) component
MMAACPVKQFIHVAKIAHNARQAENFGMQVTGKPDIKKAMDYVYGRQEIIRVHENARWLREQGIDVALGEAHFTKADEIEVDAKHIEEKDCDCNGFNPAETESARYRKSKIL